MEHNFHTKPNFCSMSHSLPFLTCLALIPWRHLSSSASMKDSCSEHCYEHCPRTPILNMSCWTVMTRNTDRDKNEKQIHKHTLSHKLPTGHGILRTLQRISGIWLTESLSLHLRRSVHDGIGRWSHHRIWWWDASMVCWDSSSVWHVSTMSRSNSSTWHGGSSRQTSQQWGRAPAPRCPPTEHSTIGRDAGNAQETATLGTSHWRALWSTAGRTSSWPWSVDGVGPRVIRTLQAENTVL